MRSTPPLPPRPLTVGHEHEPPTGATGRGSCVSGEAGSVSGTDVAHEQVANGLGMIRRNFAWACMAGRSVVRIQEDRRLP